MNDPVDVLIIGAGASGAAVAWSLAETKMHILCLEQGGWMKPSEYPSTGRDWEAKFYGDWSTSPNIRGRPEDYPINDDNSPIKVVNFNGVGGSTVMYTAHWPRLHPSDFKVKTLDGVADDWPIDYDTLTPFFDENDRMMGVSGLSGDPASPLTHPPMPPQPLGLSGPLIGKAMNKLGWHWWPSDTTVATTDYEGRARCINLGHCTPACAQGAKASTDITYWPHAIRAGVELQDALPGARDHDQRARHGHGRRLLRQGRRRAVPAGRGRDHRLQRRRHAAAVAQLGLGQISERARQFVRPGRQEPDVPPLCADLRLREGADRLQPRAADLSVEQGVLRHRSLARLRARLWHPVRPRRGTGVRGGRERAEGHPALGHGSSPRLPQAQRPPARTSPRSARICRRSTTASRSIPC